MQKLFEDGKLAEKFGKNAKQQAIESYSRDRYYDDILKIYNESIKESK